LALMKAPVHGRVVDRNMVRIYTELEETESRQLSYPSPVIIYIYKVIDRV